MKSGQFVKGKIDGIQKQFKSPELDRLLSSERRMELEDCNEIGEYPRFFKQERVIAKTVVTAAANSDGRRGGVINHTVLYSYDKDVEHDGLKYLFPTDTFISEILDGKRRFKMPAFPTLPNSDSGLIDYPTPIEWEV